MPGAAPPCEPAATPSQRVNGWTRQRGACELTDTVTIRSRSLPLGNLRPVSRKRVRSLRRAAAGGLEQCQRICEAWRVPCFHASVSTVTARVVLSRFVLRARCPRVRSALRVRAHLPELHITERSEDRPREVVASRAPRDALSIPQAAASATCRRSFWALLFRG